MQIFFEKFVSQLDFYRKLKKLPLKCFILCKKLLK